MIKHFITLLLFIFASVGFSAGVYKWKDSEGNIHYGDRPTADSAEEIMVKTGHKPDLGLIERQQKRDRLLSVLDEERNEKRSDKALAAQQKAEHELKCSEARDQLEQYRTAGYLYKLDEKGNRSILEDEAHASALENAQDSVNHWCG